MEEPKAVKEEVLKRLLCAHRAWFDVEENHCFGGRTFPGYAEFHTHGEQYVLTKRAKLWEVDAHQYLFFDTVDCLDVESLDTLVAFMKNQALDKVNLRENHMSSDLCLVVVADSVEEDAAKQLARTRFHKDYRWGFKGWTDLKLAAVDLAGGRVLTNLAGRDMRGTLEANSW